MDKLLVSEVQYVTSFNIHICREAKTGAWCAHGKGPQHMLYACPKHTTLQRTNLGPWGELPNGFPQEVADEGPKLLVYDLDINMLTGPWSREDRLMVGMSITWRASGSGACSEKHPFMVSCDAQEVARCSAMLHSAGCRG